MAKSAEIELAKKEASSRIAAANRRFKTKSLEQMLVRKGTIITTASLYGWLNRLGIPVSVAGFPWKVAIAAIAQLGEGMSKGVLQAIFGGVADSTMAIYVERSISTDTIIAGHQDEAEGDGGEI